MSLWATWETSSRLWDSTQRMLDIMPPLSKANKYFRQQLKGLKGVLFALTLAFFLESWILIIVGAVFVSSVAAQLSLTSSLSSLVSGIIFVGCLLLFMSSIGMWGIIKERKTWMRGVAYFFIACEIVYADLMLVRDRSGLFDHSRVWIWYLRLEEQKSGRLTPVNYAVIIHSYGV